MSTTRHRQAGRRLASRGFALASAIFILVVLAALAVGITLLTTQSEVGFARDLQGSRAYQAARAGLDWGAYRVLDPLNTTATAGNAPLPNCPGAAVPNVCPAAAAPASATMPVGPFASTVLASYAVTLQCSCDDFTEAGRNIRVFQLRSTATGGAGLAAVERQVSARVAYCRDPTGNPANQPPFGCS